MSTRTRATILTLDRSENHVPNGRALSAADRARVDLARVDRSHLDHYPLPRWSEEGERGDAMVTALHQDLSAGERIAAWRALFSNVDSQGRPLIRSGFLWWKKVW